MGNETKPETPDSEPGREREEKEGDSPGQAGSATRPGPKPPARSSRRRLRASPRCASPGLAPGATRATWDESPGRRDSEGCAAPLGRIRCGRRRGRCPRSCPRSVPSGLDPAPRPLRPATAFRGRGPCAWLRAPCPPAPACALGLSNTDSRAIQAEASGDQGHPALLGPAGRRRYPGGLPGGTEPGG